MATQSEINAQLQDLLAYPREELGIELKAWLDLTDQGHKADLAKALIALTNHGGGHILIGFTKIDGSYVEAPNRPPTLDAYSQDAVNGIVASYAEPQFHCQLHCVEHPATKAAFAVIVVPGIHATPVRSRRDGPHDEKGKPRHVNINCYYTRRPGPASEPPQSGQEWDQLIRRCVRASRDELISMLSNFLSGVPATNAMPVAPVDSLGTWIEEAETRRTALMKTPEIKARLSPGIWTCAYRLIGAKNKPSLAQFAEILRSVQGHETGWPPWLHLGRPEMAPYPVDGFVECFLENNSFNDGAHSDYWLGSPDGRMYLARGYQEDSPGNVPPATIFDLTIPMWRVGECLLHAQRLAEAMSDVPGINVVAAFRWSGLKGRKLVSWADPNRHLWGGRVSKQDTVRSTIETPANQISANLVALVAEVTNPVFNVFEFFEPPAALFSEELAKMLGRNS